jgi:hypothetical protein
VADLGSWSTSTVSKPTPEMIEDRDRAAGKAALREERGALHEQDDVVRIDDLVEAAVGVGHACSSIGSAVVSWSA